VIQGDWRSRRQSLGDLRRRVEPCAIEKSARYDLTIVSILIRELDILTEHRYMASKIRDRSSKIDMVGSMAIAGASVVIFFSLYGLSHNGRHMGPTPRIGQQVSGHLERERVNNRPRPRLADADWSQNRFLLKVGL